MLNKSMGETQQPVYAFKEERKKIHRLKRDERGEECIYNKYIVGVQPTMKGITQVIGSYHRVFVGYPGRSENG